MTKEEMTSVETRKRIIDAIDNDNVYDIKQLLKEGFDVNSKFTSANGRWITPLYIAVSLEALEVVDKFLSAGAEVNVGCHVASPLHSAAARGNVEIVRVLVHNGADPNAIDMEGHTAAEVAFEIYNQSHESDYISLCKYLYEKMSGEAKGKMHILLATYERQEELFEASKRGDAEKIKALLKAGADINANIHGNYTVLHAAASSGSAESVRLLLEAGANINTKLCTGMTVLHAATSSDSAESVRVLLEAGADISAEDCFGMTALQLATSNGNAEIVKLLQNAQTTQR